MMLIVAKIVGACMMSGAGNGVGASALNASCDCCARCSGGCCGGSCSCCDGSCCCSAGCCGG